MSTKRNDNPFVPVFDSIAEHDKTYDLADSLGVGRAQAVGVLVLLWQWMQKNRPDGVMENPRPAQIATACLWEGDPQLLLDGLVSSGYLVQSLPRGVAVPNWWEGGGRLVKRRRVDRDRKAGRPPREFRRSSSGTPSVEEMRGEEKRKDEKRGDAPHPTLGEPLSTGDLAVIKDALELLASECDDDGYRGGKGHPGKLRSLAKRAGQGNPLTRKQVSMAIDIVGHVAEWNKPASTLRASSRQIKVRDAAECIGALAAENPRERAPPVSGPNSGTIAELQQKHR